MRHDREPLDRSSIRKVAILRALQLGDVLCAVPAWRALRAALPQAQIALIGLPWARVFVSRFSRYFDRFVEFPGFPGLPEQPVRPDRLLRFLQEVHRERFDLILQMHGNGTLTNPLVALLGGARLAGFYAPGAYCPDPASFLPYPEGIPEVRRHLALMDFLGVPTQGEDLEFPLMEIDHAGLARLAPSGVLQPRRYVVIHPGGRAATRRWAPHGFAAVASRLAALGYDVVITGTAEERPLAVEVERLLSIRPLNLVGATDLGALAALLSNAALLVANDTGVSHVAAALKIPSVIVCTGSDPIRWSPLDRRRHIVIIGEAATVEAVTTEAAHLLEGGARVAA